MQGVAGEKQGLVRSSSRAPCTWLHIPGQVGWTGENHHSTCSIPGARSNAGPNSFEAFGEGGAEECRNLILD